MRAINAFKALSYRCFEQPIDVKFGPVTFNRWSTSAHCSRRPLLHRNTAQETLNISDKVVLRSTDSGATECVTASVSHAIRWQTVIGPVRLTIGVTRPADNQLPPCYWKSCYHHIAVSAVVLCSPNPTQLGAVRLHAAGISQFTVRFRRGSRGGRSMETLKHQTQRQEMTLVLAVDGRASISSGGAALADDVTQSKIS